MGAPSLVGNLSLHRRIAELKREWNALETPYLCALRDGTLAREDFLETQVQFLAAVAYFPRPMAVLASRLPRPEQRLPLVQNVFDEHGRGELARGHTHTFLLLLERLGADAAAVERSTVWPGVRAFNAALSGVAAFEPPLLGLAVFGAIEDLFTAISTELGRGIVQRGWLAADQVVHYPTHAELDEEHAQGFYRQLEAPYATEPGGAEEVEQGLRLGGHLLLRLYEELYDACRRPAGR